MFTVRTARHLSPLLSTSAAALVFTAVSAQGAVYADFDPARHIRFSSGDVMSSGNVTNPGFLLADFDLSAIGVGGTGGVLISDRHVLAANHNSGPGTTFRFVNPDGTRIDLASATETILTTNYLSGGMPASGPSDLALYTLASPIDPTSGLTPLPIVIGPNDDFTNAPLFAFDQDNNAGRNLIDGGLNPNSGTPIPPIVTFNLEVGGQDFPTTMVAFDFDTAANGGSNGVGGDEIGLTGGDSGHAAVTLDQFGNLAVLGVHTAILQGENHVAGDNYISFSALAAAYADEIESLVTSQGGVVTFTAIPEPVSAIFLLPAALLLRRRR